MAKRKKRIDVKALADELSTLDGHDLMQRYYKANEILESGEDKRSALYRRTKVEFDLIVAECNRGGCHLPKGSSKELAELTRNTPKRRRRAASPQQTALLALGVPADARQRNAVKRHEV